MNTSDIVWEDPEFHSFIPGSNLLSISISFMHKLGFNAWKYFIQRMPCSHFFTTNYIKPTYVKIPSQFVVGKCYVRKLYKKIRIYFRAWSVRNYGLVGNLKVGWIWMGVWVRKRKKKIGWAIVVAHIVNH